MSKSRLERAFETHLKTIGADLPKGKREYRFHKTRKWRFDWAWPDSKLAVEIDGGQWMRNGGRHARDSDREKMNEAACYGWRVLRFSGSMLKRDPLGVIGTIRRALSA